MNIIRQIFGPPKDEVWEEFSRKRRGEYFHGGIGIPSTIEIRHGHWSALLDTSYRSDESNRKITRLRSRFRTRDEFHFRLSTHHVPYLHNLGSHLERTKSRFEEIDKLYTIRTTDTDHINRFLEYQPLQNLLTDHKFYDIRIREKMPWIEDQMPQGVYELEILMNGVVKDEKRLAAMFDFCFETIQRLCDIGSAYPVSPEDDFEMPESDRLLRAASASDDSVLLRPVLGAGSADPEKLLRPSSDSTE